MNVSFFRIPKKYISIFSKDKSIRNTIIKYHDIINVYGLLDESVKLSEYQFISDAFSSNTGGLMNKFTKSLALITGVCILLSGCESKMVSDELGSILEKYGYSSEVQGPKSIQGFYFISQPKKSGQNSSKTIKECLTAYKPVTMTIEYVDFYKKADAENYYIDKWDRSTNLYNDSESLVFDTDDYKIILTTEPYWTAKIDENTYQSTPYAYHFIIQTANGSKLLFIDAVGSISEFNNDMGMIKESCSVLGCDISPLQNEMTDYLINYLIEESANDNTSD